jgi:hypothetical protein
VHLHRRILLAFITNASRKTLDNIVWVPGVETCYRIAGFAGFVDDLVKAGTVAVVGPAAHAVTKVNDVGAFDGGYLRREVNGELLGGEGRR